MYNVLLFIIIFEAYIQLFYNIHNLKLVIEATNTIEIIIIKI